MTIAPGHRFEATQALRQTLARAVAWGLLETNPAKVGVDNPLPPRREMLPFESREQLELLAHALGAQYGPMVLFAAATGLRPGEWLALEWRDIDPDARLVHVRRAFRASRVKTTKTDHPRAVPLQRSALDALDRLPHRSREATSLLFPPLKADTSIYTTGVPATGVPPIMPPASTPSGAPTISGTRSPPSRSMPASARSSSRDTWAPAS